jgi:D-lactate dehydrogenase (cytochrome)
VINPKNPNEIAEVKRLNERLVQRALALGGTCTGEHGVGYGKMDFLLSEHGEAMTLMATLKRAIDPGNIMNPGKIVRL